MDTYLQEVIFYVTKHWPVHVASYENAGGVRAGKKQTILKNLRVQGACTHMYMHVPEYSM